MVVSGNPIASGVGRDILRRGGNAVDAAVAVGFALAVVHPEAGNLGGGGFMVIRLHDGTVKTIDYRETAPSGASRDMYLDAQGEPHRSEPHRPPRRGRSRRGRGHGRGAPQARARFRSPTSSSPPFGWRATDSSSTRSDQFHPGGQRAACALPCFARRASCRTEHRPTPGTTLRQPDLASTLEAIRDSGAAGFYRGRVADLIVAEMARGGGLITRDDLAAYKAIWREPIAISYRGDTIYSMPPGLLGRRHDGRNPQRHGGLFAAPTLRLTRAAASRGRGDAARLHRPQYVPR